MSQMPTSTIRWTIADLELMPDDGTLYEIIDGELFMTRLPHWNHQRTGDNIYLELETWSRESGLGQASTNPGVIFSEDNAVVPDVAWVSHERLEVLMDEAGHITGAPDLVVEVLSPGSANERRDRQAKLRLYSLRGVREYWIVDWRLQQVEIYRRQEAELQLVTTLLAGDTIHSPLLPGFECPITRFFE